MSSTTITDKNNPMPECLLPTATHQNSTQPESDITQQDKDVEKTGSNKQDDPYLDWDGPEDPDNPMNWPVRKRNANIFLVAAVVLIINLASTMFAPAAYQLMHEFHFTNETVTALTVSIFLVGFAIGPLIWAPLSEMYGRLFIYGISTVVFFAFLLGCAFAPNLGSFMVFRVLCGCGGGSSLAIFGGTLADLVPPARRGLWLSLFTLGILLGPVIGPIIGGFIGENVGWRWVFRVLTIAAGVLLVVGALVLRETYGPVILRRRYRLRRKLNPDMYPEMPNDNALGKLGPNILRPFQLLIFSPVVFFLSLYASFYFGVIFLLFTTFSTVFIEQYGWSVGISGLSYLGLGIGCFTGLVVLAMTSDKLMVSLAAKQGEAKPEHRLFLMALVAPSLPIGIFWYGWTTDKQTHWIVPIIGTIFIGLGFIFTQMPTIAYLVDSFGANASASAIAANTLLRCIVAAFLPLAGPKMYDTLGLGWGNSLLGFIAFAMIPIPWYFYLRGDRLRKKAKLSFL